MHGYKNKQARALIMYSLEQLRETRQKEREIQELTGELRSMGVPMLGMGGFPGAFFGANR